LTFVAESRAMIAPLSSPYSSPYFALGRSGNQTEG
jgi:hypothetical protein